MVGIGTAPVASSSHDQREVKIYRNIVSQDAIDEINVLQVSILRGPDGMLGFQIKKPTSASLDHPYIISGLKPQVWVQFLAISGLLCQISQSNQAKSTAT